jgi:hypothetical protein
MSHNRVTRSTMPVRLASRDVHYISHQQLPRSLALGANKPRPNRDCQDLASLMRVPECSCARSEADVVSHAIVRREDGVHVHRSCEGLGRLLGGSVRLVSGAD